MFQISHQKHESVDQNPIPHAISGSSMQEMPSLQALKLLQPMSHHSDGFGALISD